jgi:hypothetical protein
MMIHYCDQLKIITLSLSEVIKSVKFRYNDWENLKDHQSKIIRKKLLRCA